MKNIADIDGNFKVENKLNKENIRYYSINNKHIKLFGLLYENGNLIRMPNKIAKTVSEGVCCLNSNTAGGRVRLRTNSPYIAISVSMSELGKMPHFALTGSVGFDLYEDNDYKGTFIPQFDIEKDYEGIIELGNTNMKNITINFPLYSSIKTFNIGIDSDCLLEEPLPYRDLLPIVYYGSSITQGGCASRPGMAYQSIISRRFNVDYINLGFSGNAKAEEEMAEYISKIKMSVFVYDYDYNAPTAEHLKKTHEKMFNTIRKEQQDLPIIIMSRPKINLNNDEIYRKNIIKSTFEQAVSKGDKNVFFIGGDELMKLCGDDGTVDGCHCTDLGFFSMAKAVGDVLKDILKI